MLRRKLIDLKEDGYRDFSKKLTPDTHYEILGVKVPHVKQLAKELAKNDLAACEYLKENHLYFEEYFLHGFTVCYLKVGFKEKLALLEDFLPCIDNWAICDSVAAAFPVLQKDKAEFLQSLKLWLKSGDTYHARFAVVCLIHGYIGFLSTEEIFTLLKCAKIGDYPLDMAIAWLISVLLVKDYDDTVKRFSNTVFSKFIHNKALQKAVESYRITDEKKKYLKLLKI